MCYALLMMANKPEMVRPCRITHLIVGHRMILISHVHVQRLFFYRCQDYVDIMVGTFGSNEVCGNETSTNKVLKLDFGNYTVVFRSSEAVRGEGFEMYSICFKPEERDLPSMCVYNSYSTSSVLYGLTRPCHEYQ